MESLKKDLIDKFKSLEKIINSYTSALLAYSGGVDSSFLLFVMKKVLGKKFIAVTALSPTLPEGDLEKAKQMTSNLGVEHLIVPSGELNDENFCANPPERCYYCKKELFSICREIAFKRNIEIICDGTNRDDLHDYRPGRKAVEEYGVKSPLLEAELGKEEIRRLSRIFGLPNSESPPSPCLASRFPYGVRITEERLEKVKRAEKFLLSRGFKVVRARFYNDRTLKIEVGKDELEKATDRREREEIVKFMKELGFKEILLDMEGYESGKLNRMLE